MNVSPSSISSATTATATKKKKITRFIETLNQVNKPSTADRQTPVGSGVTTLVSGWTVVGLHGYIRSVCIIFYC